jgi:outer membrane protein assembly factor BamB
LAFLLLLLPAGRAAGDATDAFEGKWLGTVTAPQASTQIAFAFARAGDGRLSVTFSMPEMAVHAAALGPARFEGDTFVLPALDTALTIRGGVLTGTFAIPHLPARLERVDALPPKPAAPEFPPGPHPLWRQSLGGNIWASPVAVDGVVYVGTTDGAFCARAAADGAERWTWRGPNPVYGSACVTRDRLFFVDAKSDLVGVDRTSGRLVWRRALFNGAADRLPWQENPTFNHRTPTPVLLDGLLYAGSPDGGVYCVDPARGTVRWRHEARTAIHATAGVDGHLLLIGGMDGSVFTLDPRTQQEGPRTKLPRAVVSEPVIASGVVVTGCRDYLLYGLHGADLTPAWRRSYWFSWVESTPALVDGTLYIGGSDYARITALDPASGSVQWATRVYGLTWGTPLVTADTVYAGTHAQRGALIPHQGGLFAIDRATGKVRWRVELPLAGDAERAGVLGSIAVAGDRIIAATFDGTLLAYPR